MTDMKFTVKIILARNLLIYFLLQGVFARAEVATFGYHFAKIDDVFEDDAPSANEIQIIDYLQCAKDNSCRYMAKPKADSSGFKRFYSRPDEHFQDVWHKNTRTGFKDCKEASDSGVKEIDVIDVRLKNGTTIKAVCDMSADGGGWTVIQRRKDSRLSFQRHWKDYKHGFGELDGNFWLGLDAVYQLVEGTASSLRIDLQDANGRRGYAVYTGFRLGNEADNYKLFLTYSGGDIGDSLGVNNGAMFTTIDRDNGDIFIGNMATLREGAWWHVLDFHSNLNSLLSIGVASEEYGYVKWSSWPNSNGLISFTEMKIRRG